MFDWDDLPERAEPTDQHSGEPANFFEHAAPESSAQAADTTLENAASSKSSAPESSAQGALGAEPTDVLENAVEETEGDVPVEEKEEAPSNVKSNAAEQTQGTASLQREEEREPSNVEIVQNLLEIGEPTQAAKSATKFLRALASGIVKYRLQKLQLQALLDHRHEMYRAPNPNLNWPLVLAQTLAQEQPNDTELQALLGRVLFLHGRKSEARDAWKRGALHEGAGGENQQLIRALVIVEDEKARGNVAFKDGKWEAACLAYTKALDADIHKVDKETAAAVLGNRSAANRKLAHFDAALADADESLRLCPSYVKGKFRRGLVLMELGRYQEALLELKAVERQDPKVAGLPDWILRASHWVSSRQKNHYATLGVPMDAPQADVARAYKSLALKWHPDKATDDQRRNEAEEKFKEINNAFEVVSDEKQRELYDYGRPKPEHVEQSRMMPKNLQRMGFKGPKMGDGLTTCLICGELCTRTSEKRWHIQMRDHPGFYDEEAAVKHFGRRR